MEAVSKHGVLRVRTPVGESCNGRHTPQLRGDKWQSHASHTLQEQNVGRVQRSDTISL